MTTVVALWVGWASGCGPPAQPPHETEEAAVDLIQAPTLAAARTLGQESGRPILLDFYTESCPPCRLFHEATEANQELRRSLSRVVIVTLDYDTDEGKELAVSYGVDIFPLFVLETSRGAEIDRWLGYGGAPSFLETFEQAIADATTFEQKLTRFEAHPTASDARALGRTHLARKDYAEALSYYQRARELDPDAGSASSILECRFMLASTTQEELEPAELRELADAVFASPAEGSAERLQVADRMFELATDKDDLSLAQPYLKLAIEHSAGASDEMLRLHRMKLQVFEALHFDHDKERAVLLQRQLLPEGWESNAAYLNYFAGWCLENRVNLEEAETLARRALELTEPGPMRAMVLETLAELCSARGEDAEATELRQRAAAEREPPASE